MKSQLSLEFSVLLSALVIGAIIFIFFYLEYTYNSAMSLTISSPNFIRSSYPLNYTHILIVVNEQIPVNSLNITYLFNLPSGKTQYTIKYSVVYSSKTQDGNYAYILNITNTPSYDPYNENYSICGIGYKYENKNLEILNINNC